MQELDDNALLREYVEHDSEEAFATLVARHINKVYSVALRHTGKPHQAEEITQAVFVILAKKSGRLGQGVVLSGWLYQTARLTAVTFLRSEIRRARREQEAHMQNTLNESESGVWPQIAPLLDTAMAQLNELDHHAVVLRFFDGKSMREVGTALGASEDAAKMRVNRALEKLRTFFTKRGVVLPAAALTAAIAAHSVQAAPVALAKSVTAVAMAKGAAASGSTLTLIKGALKIMAWTKAKTAAVAVATVIVAIGTATVVIKKANPPSETMAILNKSPRIYNHGINKAHRIPNALYTYAQGDEKTHRYLETVLKQFRKELDPARALKSDRELTETDIQTRTIYIYGSPENHSLLRRVRDQLPIVFEDDGIIVGNKKCKGRDVGAIFVCPNPLNPKNRLIIYGTVSPEALNNMNGVFHGPTDYVVFNDAAREFEGKASGKFLGSDQFLLSGAFDQSDPTHWRVAEELQLLPPEDLQSATAGVVVAR